MSRSAPAAQPAIDLPHIRKQMVAVFSLSDIRTVCFDINVDFENLPGENTVQDKCRELLEYCSNRGTLSALLLKLNEERPHVDWNQAVFSNSPETSAAPAPEPLLDLHALVRDYNRSRRVADASRRIRAASDIVLRMQALSPAVGLQLPVRAWLDSQNKGKRLAAIVYLGWLQDIEYLKTLLDMLLAEKSTYLQYHMLLTIYSMADQVNPFDQAAYVRALQTYAPEDAPDRVFWRDRIISRLQ